VLYYSSCPPTKISWQRLYYYIVVPYCSHSMCVIVGCTTAVRPHAIFFVFRLQRGRLLYSLEHYVYGCVRERETDRWSIFITKSEFFTNIICNVAEFRCTFEHYDVGTRWLVHALYITYFL